MPIRGRCRSRIYPSVRKFHCPILNSYSPGSEDTSLYKAPEGLAVDESVDATQCGGQKNCHQHGRCLTHDLWEGLSQQVEEFLGGISLQDLIDREPVRKVSEQQDSRILFHSRESAAVDAG